jgi:hypothetical protein
MSDDEKRRCPETGCLWYIATCDAGHIFGIGSYSDGPPEKMFCDKCKNQMWVDWNLTAELLSKPQTLEELQKILDELRGSFAGIYSRYATGY